MPLACRSRNLAHLPQACLLPEGRSLWLSMSLSRLHHHVFKVLKKRLHLHLTASEWLVQIPGRSSPVHQSPQMPRSPPPATAPSGSPEGLRGHSWQVPRYNAVPVPAIKDKDEEVASPRNGQRSRCSKFDCWTKLITNEKGCRTRAALGL